MRLVFSTLALLHLGLAPAHAKSSNVIDQVKKLSKILSTKNSDKIKILLRSYPDSGVELIEYEIGKFRQIRVITFSEFQNGFSEKCKLSEYPGIAAVSFRLNWQCPIVNKGLADGFTEGRSADVKIVDNRLTIENFYRVSFFYKVRFE